MADNQVTWANCQSLKDKSGSLRFAYPRITSDRSDRWFVIQGSLSDGPYRSRLDAQKALENIFAFDRPMTFAETKAFSDIARQSLKDAQE